MPNQNSSSKIAQQGGRSSDEGVMTDNIVRLLRQPDAARKAATKPRARKLKSAEETAAEKNAHHLRSLEEVKEEAECEVEAAIRQVHSLKNQPSLCYGERSAQSVPWFPAS
jgi:hypothetical protein